MTLFIEKWSSKLEAMLQDCFATDYWNMFWAADNIGELTTSITRFIRKCIADVVHPVKVRCFPNQKPWINTEVGGN